MKKIILIFLILCFGIIKVEAKELESVTLEKCIDGDTASFKYKDNIVKFRFLAIDTPELKKKDEYAKEASEYTCDSLKKAKKIEVEFDTKGSKQDKYGRYLAWIYVDSKLLQESLVELGYAEVAYVYANYEYVPTLCDYQKEAINKKAGIWSNENRKEGYCKTKSNKKVTTTTKKTENDIEDEIDRIYQKHPIIAYIVIIVLVVFSLYGKNTKRKRK